MPQRPWPELSALRDGPTIATLHLVSQIVGKTAVALLPWRNHGWHAAPHLHPPARAHPGRAPPPPSPPARPEARAALRRRPAVRGGPRPRRPRFRLRRR